jgi:DNA/RNA-binding domain of Phe-tRNA-synthetase-like protein
MTGTAKRSGSGRASRANLPELPPRFPSPIRPLVEKSRGGLAEIHLCAVKCAIQQPIAGGGRDSIVKIQIDPELKKKCPRTALGCLTACVQPGASAVTLLAEMNQRELEIQELPFPRGVLESPQVETVRKAYKSLGKDPARYRGSAEALLRRIVAGKGFPQINVVVDIINLVSVESRLPVGLYDLGHVVGDIVFRAGRAGETYKGIGKFDLNLEGLPVFADVVGPHGSPTSDSERTMVTPETKEVLAIIVSFAGPENVDRWTQRMSALLVQHAAAENVGIQVVQ